MACGSRARSSGQEGVSSGYAEGRRDLGPCFALVPPSYVTTASCLSSQIGRALRARARAPSRGSMVSLAIKESVLAAAASQPASQLPCRQRRVSRRGQSHDAFRHATAPDACGGAGGARFPEWTLEEALDRFPHGRISLGCATCGGRGRAAPGSRTPCTRVRRTLCRQHGLDISRRRGRKGWAFRSRGSTRRRPGHPRRRSRLGRGRKREWQQRWQQPWQQLRRKRAEIGYRRRTDDGNFELETDGVRTSKDGVGGTLDQPDQTVLGSSPRWLTGNST